MTDTATETRLLGPQDEPQHNGAIVVVHYGDYRAQEIWVSSGANIGNWYPLGGEFGRPKVWDDPRSYAEKLFDRAEPTRPAGTIPQHPHWEDVLARGPVTLLVPAGAAAYLEGWRNGRRAFWQDMEDAAYDDPPNP